MPIRLYEPEMVPEPPMSLAPDGLVLPATIVLVSVRRCRNGSMPAAAEAAGVAADGAVGQRGRATVLSHKPPPCRLAELPLTVQLVSVAVPPTLVQAAAVMPGGVAADGAVGQRGRAAGCCTGRRRR